ncbi:MAG: Fe-S cluster assembly sulfur transfer protein SufU [Methanobacteriota archaeon]
MSDLRELYQEVILDHSRRPHNFRILTEATRRAEGDNPLCGDQVTVFLRLGADDRIDEVAFQGHGCAISKASASLMTDAVKGKTVSEAQALFDRFHHMVTGARDDRERLGKLAVFSGVSDYPARVKCATLAWHTLRAALQGRPETVSTEEGEA